MGRNEGHGRCCGWAPVIWKESASIEENAMGAVMVITTSQRRQRWRKTDGQDRFHRRYWYGFTLIRRHAESPLPQCELFNSYRSMGAGKDSTGNQVGPDLLLLSSAASRSYFFQFQFSASTRKARTTTVVPGSWYQIRTDFCLFVCLFVFFFKNHPFYFAA